MTGTSIREQQASLSAPVVSTAERRATIQRLVFDLEDAAKSYGQATVTNEQVGERYAALMLARRELMAVVG